MGLEDLFQQGQKRSATDPNQAGTGLNRLFSQGPKVSAVQGQPITNLEKAQSAMQAYRQGVDKPQERSLLPEGIGATAGSLALERVANEATKGLPPGLKHLGVPIRVASATLGAFGGGAGGRGYQQVFTGDIGPISEMYGLKGQLGSGLREARNELVGQGVGGIIGRTLTGGLARGSLKPGMIGMSEMLEDAGTRVSGIGMTPKTRKLARAGRAGLSPGQQGSKGFRSFERFIQSSYIGGGSLNAIMNEVNPAANKVLKKELVEKYWDEAGGAASKDEIAAEVSGVLDKNYGAFKQSFSTKLLNGKRPMDPVLIGETAKAARDTVAVANKKRVTAAYNTVEELAKESGIASLDVGGIVPLTNAFKAADEIKAKWANMGDSSLKKQMIDLADVVLTGSPKTTIENADKGIRSQLLAESRKLDVAGSSRSKNPTLKAAVEKLQKAVNADLQGTLDSFDPVIMDALTDARGLAAKNATFEDNPFVKHITKVSQSESPEKLIPAIFSEGSPLRIELAQRALGKETVTELADTWLNKTVTDAMSDPKSIGGALEKKLDKMGSESLLQMFGKKKTDDLYALSKMFKNNGAEFIENNAFTGAVNLIDSNPSPFINKIYQKDNAAGLAKWNARLPKQTRRKLLAGWIDQTFNLPEGKILSAVDSMGDKMLKQMFPDPEHLAYVRKVARVDDIVAASGGGTSVLAPIMEASAMASLITQPVKAVKRGAATLVGGLGITGALLSHKKSAMYLAKGMSNPHKFEFWAQKASAELLRHSQTLAREKKRRRTKSRGLRMLR